MKNKWKVGKIYKLKIIFKTTDFYNDTKNLKCKKLLNERWVEDEDKISSINKMKALRNY